ncbi:MAG: twitching motility protein PilT [Cyanobacteria bacterium P01_A01_bin.17]
MVEVAYLIGRDVGIPTVVKFLQGISTSRFTLIEATAKDIERTADILNQYADSKVDFVDASVMAIAERLDITTVLTIDRRDFSLFRPLHCQNFMLRP